MATPKKGTPAHYKIEKVIDKIAENSLVDVQNMMLGIHSDLRRNTPRDTGWAANNWIASKGQPIEHTVGTPQTVVNSPQGIVDVLTYSKEDIEAGLPIFIANNVPYINRLNNGWSKKQPAGFVQRAIQKAEKGGYKK